MRIPSAPTTYAARAPRTPPANVAINAGTPTTITARKTSGSHCSSDQESAFQVTTCRHTSGTESRYTVTAAAIVATAAPNTNRASAERSARASQAARANAGRNAVGFAKPAKRSAKPATAARSRRRSSVTTPTAVSARARRSGFTAGPQTNTGASASQPAASAAAASRPADRAETNTVAATARVDRMLTILPVTKASPTEAICRYSGG